MSDDKSKKKLSRRDLLMGPLNRLRRNTESLAGSVAGSAPKPKPDAAAGDDHFTQGSAAFAARDYQGAADHFRAHLKTHKNHYEARQRLGYCLYRLRQFVQAKVEFSRTLRELEKDNFSSLYLGLTLARMGKAEAAVKAWKGYFNHQEVRIMREINLQVALLESPSPPDPAECADEVEEAVEERKRELTQDR